LSETSGQYDSEITIALRFESPAWHAQVLREAERAMKSGKAKFSDWDEAKKRIRRKAAKLA
jgi:hypothetical protein